MISPAFLATFAAIFLAELGDKTQLLTLGFSTKFKPWTVILAVTAATSVLMGIAVLFGGAISYWVPEFFLQLAAGLIFVAFGLWILKGGEDECEDQKNVNYVGNPFIIVFSSFFLAELGDKTQIATFGLAAKYGDPLTVWMAATSGMVLVNIIAALSGAWISKLIPQGMIRLLSALIFLVFGAVTLIGLLS